MSRGGSATSRQSVQDAKKRMQKFLKSLDTIPTEILQEEVPVLTGEILAEIPYKTGKLESSVKVSVARDKRRPGINAGIQHENEDFQHSKPGAKAHFISDPLNKCVDRVTDKMRKRLKP